MKKLNIGILAHVDAGKTTLSESMLFVSGKIKKMGRVDHQDAYLDTNSIERQRGITIFAKQALIHWKMAALTLLDTPGHVDFSAEMERTLQVLDYAVLVISGADGIQGHTKTLWRLLALYEVPTFIFVNKMDQPGTDCNTLMHTLKKELSAGCVSIEDWTNSEIQEEIAMADEILMDEFLFSGAIDFESITLGIVNRKLFPVAFGSALKLQGVELLLNYLSEWTVEPEFPTDFGARVFKISRDSAGNRLTHLKVTGGRLSVRDVIRTSSWEEKVTQIRKYSGDKYESVMALDAGEIGAITGLSQSIAGEGYGNEEATDAPILEPVLSYRLILEPGIDVQLAMPKLKRLEEETPELKLSWDELHQEIHVQIMGEVQLEVIQTVLKERFDLNVTFGDGSIVYKETILDPIIGVGHFEPLRHYSEVHLLLEPLPRGSGIVIDNKCSEEILDINWQNLVLGHLKEKVHKGVLIGAAVTDLKITLIAGRAHNKHTVGGDFRQATYRAVRQGLKSTRSKLLEPYYSFRLEIPADFVGRVMQDVERQHGICELEHSDGVTAVLSGRGPVATFRNYQKEVIAYTKGYGRLLLEPGGYWDCHNESVIIDMMDYDSERDLSSPTGSVFCSQGTGFIVSWDQVYDHMHVTDVYEPLFKKDWIHTKSNLNDSEGLSSDWISLEEIDALVEGTSGANRGRKSIWKKKRSARDSYYESLNTANRSVIRPRGKPYLLVDGYNILFAWDDFKRIAADNLEGARNKLLELLSHYKSLKQTEIIVVFDAYRVEGGREKTEVYHNIHVVFTAEAQTADQYIERFTRLNEGAYEITVATSEGLQQVIIRGSGSQLLSARELRNEIDLALKTLREEHLTNQKINRNRLEDILSEDVLSKMKHIGK